MTNTINTSDQQRDTNNHLNEFERDIRYRFWLLRYQADSLLQINKLKLINCDQKLTNQRNAVAEASTLMSVNLHSHAQ